MLDESELWEPPDYRRSLKNTRIWVAGHTGLVGSAVARRLYGEGCWILTVDHAKLDLTRQADVEAWLKDRHVDIIVLAAAKVGGILANETRPADFLYSNLAIQTNLIAAAHKWGVNRMLLLGSSCIYPRSAPQPITEDALLTGPLEPTNDAYAIANIAGIKACQAYRKQYHRDYVAAMPTNVYGPGDNFDLESSHVLPALIRKAHEAKLAGSRELIIWGSGTPRREFLRVDDCADALVHILKRYHDPEPINVGSGSDLTILELAEAVAKAVGFHGAIKTDPTKPDGTPRKLMSGAKLTALGWKPRISLVEGLAQTYAWYLDRVAGRGDDVRARAPES
jgi:GDP-L-fucose synthase